MSCGTIHQKILNELPYLEDDKYESNILYKTKKFIFLINILKKIFLKLNMKGYMILF